MNAETLRRQFDVMAEAPNGVQKLRELILQLAVRGKLVAQDAGDEPASVLLERIAAEKAQLFDSGKGGKAKPMPAINDCEPPYALPGGWIWARFGEVISGIDAGWSPQCDPQPRRTGEWGVIKISAVTWGSFNPDENKALPTRLEPRPEYEIRAGDFLMTRANTAELVGRSVVVGRTPTRLLLNDKTLRVRIPALMDRQYTNLFNNCRAARFYYAENASGTSSSMRNLSREQIQRLPFALPPLAEQHRIVAKVDELMALCDKLEAQQQQRTDARAQLNRAVLHHLTAATDDAELATHWQRLRENFHLLYDTPETVAELRQAVLQLAVRGKLVAQDAGDEPASVLLERIAVEKRRLRSHENTQQPTTPSFIGDDETAFDLPRGWRTVRADDLLTYITSGSRGWAQHYADSGAIFLRIGNLDYEAIELDLRSVQRVKPPVGAEGSRTRVLPGDILISITGDTGMVGLIPTGFEEAYINQHVALARPSTEVHAPWLARYCTSSLARDHFTDAQRGIKNSLGLDDIRAIPVYLPPLAEQHRIVARVDQLIALCDDLEARLTRTREHSAQLAASVVHQLTAA